MTSAHAPLPQTAADLPVLPREFWQTLDDGLTAAAIQLEPHAREAIDRHARLLIAWNAAINLTALRTPEQIARGHVLDSLIAAETLRAFKPATLLDLGSGGGFPGLPLASVLPLQRVALVDSIGKKARFLEVAARAVGASLPIPPTLVTLAERAEDLAEEPDQRDWWDVVVARAVGTVAEVAELGLPLVHRGGHVVAWKRDVSDGSLKAEVGAARSICQAAGGSSPRVVPLAVAESVGLTGHCLVIIDKRRPTPDRYPRPPSERRR